MKKVFSYLFIEYETVANIALLIVIVLIILFTIYLINKEIRK